MALPLVDNGNADVLLRWPAGELTRVGLRAAKLESTPRGQDASFAPGHPLSQIAFSLVTPSHRWFCKGAAADAERVTLDFKAYV